MRIVCRHLGDWQIGLSGIARTDDESIALSRQWSQPPGLITSRFQGGPDAGQRSRLTDGHRGDAPANGMSAMGIEDAVHRWA
jgi:hypothetical protein